MPTKYVLSGHPAGGEVAAYVGNLGQRRRRGRRTTATYYPGDAYYKGLLAAGVTETLSGL